MQNILTFADMEALAGFRAEDVGVEIVDGDAVPWDDIEVIDCAADPYDLRPAAEMITRLIEERFASSPDGRLLVQFGEAHDRPSHPALEQMVVSRLVKAGLASSLTVAFELPANIMNLSARGPMDGYAMAAIDPVGDACLKYLLTRYAGAEAPVSLRSFAGFLRRNRVRTIFNDAGRIRIRDEQFLDPDDPFFKARGISVGEEISSGSNEGMSLRNIRMTETAYAQGGLVLQVAGLKHIFGNGFQRALIDCARERDMDVLNVLLKMPSVTMSGSGAVYVKGICDESFLHEEDDDEDALEASEQSVLKTIFRESHFGEGLDQIDADKALVPAQPGRALAPGSFGLL